MKEWKKVILALAIAIIVIVILLVIAITLIDRCIAQEGCGRWVEAQQSFEFTTGKSAYMFWWHDSLPVPDSVWVLEKCSSVWKSAPNLDSLEDQSFVSGDTLCNGDWYLQLRLESVDLTIRIRLDTLWQVAESVWIEKDQGEWLYPEFHIEE